MTSLLAVLSALRGVFCRSLPCREVQLLLQMHLRNVFSPGCRLCNCQQHQPLRSSDLRVLNCNMICEAFAAAYATTSSDRANPYFSAPTKYVQFLHCSHYFIRLTFFLIRGKKLTKISCHHKKKNASANPHTGT